MTTNVKTREETSLISLNLPADALRSLPEAAREQIISASPGISGDWTLVGTASAELGLLVRRVLTRLEPMVAMHRRHLSDHNIEIMVESILSDLPREEIHARLEMDNASLRADYLRDTPVLAGPEVRIASGLNPRNPSEPASRWKRERRIFAVRYGGRDLFPAFQFEDGQPHPVIKRILAEVSAATPWQIALWFASGNGWLGGAEPQKSLDDTDKILDAARDFANPVEG